MTHRCLALFAVLLLSTGLRSTSAAGPMALKDVKTFMDQEQITSRRPITRLAKSGYDMLIVDVLHTLKGGSSQAEMADAVQQFRKGHEGRVVLAYFTIAEAETERVYWTRDWDKPGKNSKGTPDFLLAPDPQGLSDQFVVAYWDMRWHNLLANGPDCMVDKTMAAGFDGLLLDWTGGYASAPIAAEAARQHVDPAHAIINLIAAIRARARRANPNALIVPRDGVDLIDADPRYLDLIDGVMAQGTWFGGQADSGWASWDGGDVPGTNTAALLKQYARYLKAGKPVFTIDYCLKGENAAKVYSEAAQAGVVPLVTRASLAGMTTTPPPALAK